jgi:chromatin remodeling complex protein RSC6
VIIVEYKMPKKVSKKKASTTAPASVKAAAKSATAAKSVASKSVAPKSVAKKTAVVEAKPETVEVPSLSDQFADLLSQLSALRTQLSTVTTQARVLSKRSERELKQALKASKKKKKSGSKEPSGFTKPAQISSELATFLGKAQGTEMARTEVTKELQKYILSHNLQDPANRRNINPDAKLRKLLGMKKSDSLTYFNLQKWMKPHFKTNSNTLVGTQSA